MLPEVDPTTGQRPLTGSPRNLFRNPAKQDPPILDDKAITRNAHLLHEQTLPNFELSQKSCLTFALAKYLYIGRVPISYAPAN